MFQVGYDNIYQSDVCPYIRFDGSNNSRTNLVVDGGKYRIIQIEMQIGYDSNWYLSISFLADGVYYTRTIKTSL